MGTYVSIGTPKPVDKQVDNAWIAYIFINSDVDEITADICVCGLTFLIMPSF